MSKMSDEKKVRWWEMINWPEFDLEFIKDIPDEEAREYALNHYGSKEKMNEMNLEDWEEFWAHLVGDYLIVDEMGPNHLDNVGEFLEWQRQEWIKYHHECPDCGITKAGREFIQTGRKFVQSFEVEENDI